MKHVYAFKYTNVLSDEIHECGPKHLVAESLAQATEFANQFLVDDGLRSQSYMDAGFDWQVSGVNRLMKIDWPVEE